MIGHSVPKISLSVRAAIFVGWGKIPSLKNQVIRNRVSLWGQFFRLATCAIAIFGVVATIWYVIDFQLAASANRVAASEKRALFSKLLELQGRDLDALLDSRGYLDDFSGFFSQTPRNTGVATQSGPSAKAVFVFDDQWNSRYQTPGAKLSATDLESIQTALKSPDAHPHFYSWYRASLVEYRAKAILDSLGALRGYVIARADWRNDKIEDLSRITESEASIVLPGQSQPPVTDQGYTVTLPLQGADGSTVAELRLVVRTDALLFAMNRSRLAGVFLLLLMIGLTSALMATVVRKLISPPRQARPRP